MILTKTNSYLTLVFSLTRIAKSGVPLDSYTMHHGTVMCKKNHTYLLGVLNKKVSLLSTQFKKEEKVSPGTLNYLCIYNWILLLFFKKGE